jgi:hypothetical protein
VLNRPYKKIISQKYNENYQKGGFFGVSDHKDISMKNHFSEVNVIKHLLGQQENKMNRKMLSRRLKSQRENYLLRTNQDIEVTEARNTLTSLQKVRKFEITQNNLSSQIMNN